MNSILDCTKGNRNETAEERLGKLLSPEPGVPELVEAAEVVEPVKVVEPAKEVKPEPRKDCRYCGAVRKPGVEFYSADHCSGKCAKADGEEIIPQAAQGDDEETVSKLQEIGTLGNLLIPKRKEVDELDKQLEKLRDEKGDLLAKAQSTGQNQEDFADVFARKIAIEDDIRLIENETLPKKHSELDAIKRDKLAPAREKLMSEKNDIVIILQNLFYEINCNVEYWHVLQKESGVSLNPKAEDLFGGIIIQDRTRKQLRRRIAGRRIAKLAVYPKDD